MSMTTNNQTLREAAEKAISAHDRISIMPTDDIFDISLAEGTQLDDDITALNAFHTEASPATVLAKLDELEAAERRNAELQSAKPRLPPHKYRDCVDVLQECAIAYVGSQQLRAQLSAALAIFVEPDHPHTRAAATDKGE